MSSILGMIFIDEYDTAIEVLKGGNQSTQQLVHTIKPDSTPADIANAIIKKYEAEARILYICGHQTFMTKTDKGDSETYYLHVIYKYVPYFMQIIYSRHRLGIAIFNMEPFEFKNFTSKQVVLYRTNRKGNICKQSLCLLQIYFKTSFHDVKAEIKQRKKARVCRSEEQSSNSSTTNTPARQPNA